LYYNCSDDCWMWQTINDYKGKYSWDLASDTSLADEVNIFYARFEANNTETCMRAPAVLEDCMLCCNSLCWGARISLLYLEYFSCLIWCPVWIKVFSL
jgi:hypothetical protein